MGGALPTLPLQFSSLLLEVLFYPSIMPMTAEKKHAGGRRPIVLDVAKVEKLAEICQNDAEIAYAIGVCPRTFTTKKQNPEIQEALERGRARANTFVAGKLMQAIKDGNVTAMIFWLKSRGGWMETDRHEVEVNQPVQIVVKNDLKD